LERRDYKIGTTETEVRCRNSKSIAGNEFLLSFFEEVLAEK
jgi:hypothetical protein